MSHWLFLDIFDYCLCAYSVWTQHVLFIKKNQQAWASIPFYFKSAEKPGHLTYLCDQPYFHLHSMKQK